MVAFVQKYEAISPREFSSLFVSVCIPSGPSRMIIFSIVCCYFLTINSVAKATIQEIDNIFASHKLDLKQPQKW